VRKEARRVDLGIGMAHSHPWMSLKLLALRDDCIRGYIYQARVSRFVYKEAVRMRLTSATLDVGFQTIDLPEFLRSLECGVLRLRRVHLTALFDTTLTMVQSVLSIECSIEKVRGDVIE
jgi:hypothetical protein